jgi:hypothetical protein
MNFQDASLLNRVKQRLSLPANSHKPVLASNKLSHLKILGLVGDFSACGYYRVINPLTVMKMHGAKVEITPVIHGNMLKEFDIILAPRQYNRNIKMLLEEAMYNGIPVVYELDDDLSHVEPSNPAFAVYYKGSEDLKGVSDVIQLCSGMVTSTPECKAWYSQDNKNIHVIDNFIDYSLRDWGATVSWNGLTPNIVLQDIVRPKEWEDKFIIGYSGGDSHLKDFEGAGAALKRALEDLPNVYLALYCSPFMAEKFVNAHQLPSDKIIFIEPRHFLDHPKGLQGIDLQLAPLAGNQFNICKTPLKQMEAMAVGSATLATCIAPYARLHDECDGINMLVGKGTGKNIFPNWSSAINYCVNNQDKVRELGRVGRLWIKDHKALENNFTKWLKTFDLIVENCVNNVSGPPLAPPTIKEAALWGNISRNDKCPITGTKYKKSPYFGAYGE